MSKLTYRPRSKLEVFYTGGAAKLSRDGTLLACSCGDDVKVVDVATGGVIQTLAGDSEPVTALAWSPSGKLLISASRSLQTRCWDVASAQVKRSWKGHRAPVADLAVDASGGLVASGSADRSVRVWDADGGFCTHVFTGHSGVVMRVMFHPKQLMVVSSSDDAEVRVWDLVDKSCVATLKGHYSAVTSLTLAPDGWTLVTGGRDKVAMLWDLRTHTKLASVPVYEAIEGVVALPAGSSFPGITSAASAEGSKVVYFATGGEKGRVKIWRSDTAQCVYETPATGSSSRIGADGGVSAGGEITQLMMLPEGKGLVAVTGDCRFQILEPQSGALHMARQLIGNNDEITDIRFVGPPAAPTHLAVATNSDQIRLFDAASFSCTAGLLGHSDIVLCLDALPLQDGRTLLLSGAKDNTIRLWEAPSGRCIGHGDGHIAAVSAVAFSRRSPAFMVSGGADKLLKVWDLASVLKSDPGAARSGGDGGMEAAGKLVQLRVTAAVAAHDKDINALAVSPNDALICTASQDRTAKVWKLPSLVPVLTLRGHRRGIWAAQFSPVDQCIATASGDKTIKLWALADGSCLKTFEGHTASVLRISFLSAGTQLLSSGADGLLKLWAVRSSECVNTFDEHEDKVWALAVAGAQEELIATGGGDATLTIWEDSTSADEAAAAAAEQELALRQQDLSNALQAEDFAAAAELAFELKQPRRLLAVVNTALDKGPAEAESILARLVAGFQPEQLKACLEYARDWNTNAKTCHAAQAVLRVIFQQHNPKDLVRVGGMADLLEGLIGYSGRHYSRVDRLVRSTFLLDYTLAAMNVLAPAQLGDGGDGVREEDITNGGVEAANGTAAVETRTGNGASMPEHRTVMVEQVTSMAQPEDVRGVEEVGPDAAEASGRVAAGDAGVGKAGTNGAVGTAEEAAVLPSSSNKKRGGQRQQKSGDTGSMQQQMKGDLQTLRGSKRQRTKAAARQRL